MNNTTYEVIQASLKFYDRITIYYINNTIILSDELKKDLPANLKTPAKLKFLKTFGENITQDQFIKLLMYQTTGADFLNITYLAKYYNLQYDNNKMIIWTELCPYTSLKQEAINNWHIWHTLTTHNMFSKYMHNLLEFKLQNQLEHSIFPTRENFRDDLYFKNLRLINSTNESQHNLKAQKVLDAEKIALNKMNGNSVISFYTSSLVNIKEINQKIYKDLYNNADYKLDSLLQEIYAEHAITDVTEENIIKNYTMIVIRIHFKKSVTVAQKRNTTLFKALPHADKYINTIMQLIDNYLLVINETIHFEIKNNNYLKCYMSTLLDVLLSACLHDFAFRQDYLQTIVMENLIISMASDIDYLYYIKDLEISEKENMYEQKLTSFNNLRSITEQFVANPDNFIELFGLKIKSLQDVNNTNTITYQDICNLFEEKDLEAKEELRSFLNITCNIKINVLNTDIKLSWKQLQIILLSYNKKKSLQRVLSLYYTEIDTIYEFIIMRLQQDAKRLICTPDNFKNYSGRMYKKFTIIINKHKNRMQEIINYNIGLNTIVNNLSGTSLQNTHALPSYDIVKPPNTVLETIIGFNYINLSDAEKVSNTDANARVNAINDYFNKLHPIVIVNNMGETDSDEVDSD